MMTETLITRLKRFHQSIDGSAITYDLTIDRDQEVPQRQGLKMGQ